MNNPHRWLGAACGKAVSRPRAVLSRRWRSSATCALCRTSLALSCTARWLNACSTEVDGSHPANSATILRAGDDVDNRSITSGSTADLSSNRSARPAASRRDSRSISMAAPMSFAAAISGAMRTSRRHSSRSICGCERSPSSIASMARALSNFANPSMARNGSVAANERAANALSKICSRKPASLASAAMSYGTSSIDRPCRERLAANWPKTPHRIADR